MDPAEAHRQGKCAHERYASVMATSVNFSNTLAGLQS